MNSKHLIQTLLASCAIGCALDAAQAQDWPQFRGPNRDAKAAQFVAPASWPKALTQQWKVTVGEGVATPALVGDQLFVFARQEQKEILRCLDAATDPKAHKELARYKVSDTPTHAYPVASGNRLFVKDADSLILWTVP